MRCAPAFLTVLLLAGCDASSTTADGQPAAVEHGIQVEPDGCTRQLAVEIDQASFEQPGVVAGPAELARWGEDAGNVFKSAGNALCEEGKIDTQLFHGAKTLLVQYGGGADSAAVWQDEAKPDAVILQYAFSIGSPGPGHADVRDGIICWNNPNEARCAERRRTGALGRLRR